MKKSSRLSLLVLGALLLAGLFSGCNNGKLSTIEYNNKVVDILNSTSAAIEETTKKYDEAIPNIVSEDSKIDVEALKLTGKEAETQLEAAKKVLELQSREPEQEIAIKNEFNRYMELGASYMTAYNEMVIYYENGEFAKKLDGVEEYDEKLHTGYNDFINSNNMLVDILANFVK